jgi:hypothetical protein
MSCNRGRAIQTLVLRLSSFVWRYLRVTERKVAWRRAPCQVWRLLLLHHYHANLNRTCNLCFFFLFTLTNLVISVNRQSSDSL